MKKGDREQGGPPGPRGSSLLVLFSLCPLSILGYLTWAQWQVRGYLCSL